MKRCPDCRRDYYDETLLYCLDDGTALLEGPASGDSSMDEPATAILHETAPPGETATQFRPNDPSKSESSDPSSIHRPVSRLDVGKLTIVLGIVAVLAVAILIGYKFIGNRQALNSAAAKKITRLTSTGTTGNATISPDGKYVVYSAVDETTRQSSLWLRHVATSSNAQIVPPAGPGINFSQITFSPDSNYIYFVRIERNIPGALYEVPVLGGSPKKILDDVTRISFSPDGSRFAFTRRDAKGEDAVRIANADGSNEQVLSVRKHPDYYLPGLSWSPDGQTIACPMGGWEGGYYRSITFIAVSDGRDQEVPRHRFNTLDRVDWLSDGSGVLTTANDQPTDPYQIWMVQFPTGEARTLTNDLNDYRNVSLTADSSALVVLQSDTTANLWVTTLAQPGGGQQLTSSKYNGNSGVAWTPDGRITYVSRDSGASEIWIIGPDGHGKRQLTDDGSGKRYPCVTADGRSVIFDSHRSGNIQLWKAGIDGSAARVVTSGPGFGADCSRTDESVIYTTFSTGGFRIWKGSADGGNDVQLIDKYALIPSISPDGKSIACFYVADSTRATKLGIFPAEGGEPINQFDLLVNAGSGTPNVRWMPDGRAVAYIASQGGVSNIWVQPIDGGPPKQLTDLTTGRIFWFDISRDGKQLALSRGTQTSDVVLMKDFR
jgi:Tol biopolymer transport system component